MKYIYHKYNYRMGEGVSDHGGVQYPKRSEIPRGQKRDLRGGGR
jgi:hypothetical protein